MNSFLQCSISAMFSQWMTKSGGCDNVVVAVDNNLTAIIRFATINNNRKTIK